MTSLAWHFIFWTFGEYLLNHVPGGSTSSDPSDGSPRQALPVGCRAWTMSTLIKICNPNVLAIFAGIIISSARPLQALFFVEDEDDDLATDERPVLIFMTSACKTIGNSAVGIITLVAAATIGKRLATFKVKGFWRQPTNNTKIGVIQFSSLSQDASDNTCEPPPMDEAVVMELAPAVQPPQPTRTIETSLIIKLVVVRVVVLGAIQFALTYTLSGLVFPDSNQDSKLVRMVLFVQSITSSAPFLVIACQQSGQRFVAEATAIAVFFQTILVAFLLIPSTALSLDLLYSDT